MTSSTETNFDKLSNDDLMRLYLEGIQVYEDQIEIMDYVRKKSIEVRIDLVDLENELHKRRIQIKEQDSEQDLEQEKEEEK